MWFTYGTYVEYIYVCILCDMCSHVYVCLLYDIYMHVCGMCMVFVLYLCVTPSAEVLVIKCHEREDAQLHTA